MHQLLEVLELERPRLLGVQVATLDVGDRKPDDAGPADFLEDEPVKRQDAGVVPRQAGVDPDLLPHGAEALVVVAVLEDALLPSRVRHGVYMARQSVELGQLGAKQRLNGIGPVLRQLEFLHRRVIRRHVGIPVDLVDEGHLARVVDVDAENPLWRLVDVLCCQFLGPLADAFPFVLKCLPVLPVVCHWPRHGNGEPSALVKVINPSLGKVSKYGALLANKSHVLGDHGKQAST